MARKKKEDDRSVMLCPPQFRDAEGKPDFFHPKMKYPTMASIKIDGNRVFCRAGELLTRSMIAHPNKNLPMYLSGLCAFAAARDLCFDMELVDRNAGHHGDNTSVTNAHNKEIPESFAVYVFDCVRLQAWNSGEDATRFSKRYEAYQDYISIIADRSKTPDRYIAVEQTLIATPAALKARFEKVVAAGHEGLIATHPDSPYLPGRCTPKEAYRTKWKLEETDEARVVEVQQQREMKEGIERTRNRWGYKEAPTKNDDNFDWTESVGALVVENEKGIRSKLAFGIGWDHDKRRALWKCQNDLAKTTVPFPCVPGQKVKGPLIGQMVEFLHVPVGALDGGKVRHGRLIRFRPDKGVR